MKKTIAVLCAISASAVLGADWTYSSNKITDGNWTLKTSTVSSGDDVTLLRLGWTYNAKCRTEGSGELDLTKPITDANGKIYKITEIGYQAFFKDDSLVRVTLPRELQCLCTGGQAFSNCTNLLELIANCPEFVSMGNNDFQGCTKLDKMVFKAPKLAKINQYAFQYCPLRETSFTTDIDITGVTEIGHGAFQQREENAGPSGRLYLPKIAKLNNQNSFTKCAQLETVEVGDKTTGLEIGGTGMFSGCTSLKKVILRGKSFSLGWSKNYFDDCPLEEVYFWGNYPKVNNWDGLNNMLNYMFKSVPAPVDNVKFCRIYTSTKSGTFPYVALNATEKENIPADIAGSVLGAYAPPSMGNGRCAWVVKWHSPLDGGLTLVVR